MRKLIFIFLILSCLPVSTFTSPKKFQAELVRIYTGPGSSEICLQAWMHRLKTFLIEKCKNPFIAHGFSDFSELIQDIKEKPNGLLLVPGGKALAMGLTFHKALAKEKMDQEDFQKLFKAQNWAYLGNCAGAYFAAKSSSADIVHLDEKTDVSFDSRELANWRSLGFFPIHFHSLFPYETAVRDVSISWSGGKALFVKEFDAYSMWIGGPNLNKVKGEVLFSDQNRNTLGINLRKDGKPPIIIMNIHPEFSDGVLKYVHKARGYSGEELKKHTPAKESDMIHFILSHFL